MVKQLTGSQLDRMTSTGLYPSTSSAFSAYAHPNEDWTKITDGAERRKIQNRIAQRVYRKTRKKESKSREITWASHLSSQEAKPTKPKSRKPKRSQQIITKQHEAQNSSSNENARQPESMRSLPVNHRNICPQPCHGALSISPPHLGHHTGGADLSSRSPSSGGMSNADFLFWMTLPIFPKILPPLPSPITPVLATMIQSDSLRAFG